MPALGFPLVISFIQRLAWIETQNVDTRYTGIDPPFGLFFFVFFFMKKAKKSAYEYFLVVTQLRR